MKNIIKFLVPISILAACGKNDNPIDYQNEETIGVTLVDTFTVKASTILLDSISTSGTGTILLGELNDSDFGKISNSSYFPLQAETTFPEFTQESRFDSLMLSFNYAGYSYGDTTKTASFDIFQLTQEIKPYVNPRAFDPDQKSLLSVSGVLYNNSKIPHANNPLGKIFLKKQLGSKDSVNVKLNQQLGETLFSMIYDKDPRISTVEEFNKFFKGLAIIPSGGDMNSVAGYSSSSLKMRIYYSEPNLFGIRRSKNIVFKIVDSVRQFNAITADRSASVLKGLSYTNRQIPVSLTANKGFIQAGTGIVTKINFPHLGSFFQDNSKVMNKAELHIEIPGNPNNQFLPPKTLNLIIADQKDRPQEIIRNSFQPSDQLATLKNTTSGGRYAGSYTFEITEYLDKLKKSNTNVNIPLLISVPLSRMNKSLERTSIGGPGNEKATIKLNIFYTQFK